MENWLTAKEGANYAKENYRDHLEKMKSGEIRSVRRGKRYMTTSEWEDNYLFSLEEKSMLCR